MNPQTNELDRLLSNVFELISEAAKKHDLASIRRHTVKATELEELKQQHLSIQQRIASLSSAESAESLAEEGQANGKLRELPIEVTGGMKRQNLLTLTPHVKRRKIKAGEQLIIEALPSGVRFQTELLEQGNRLRARSEIAQFYRDAKVNEGDYVLLSEVAPGRWTLKKAPSGAYGLSKLMLELGG